MNLNELSKQVHAANIKWWKDIHTGEPIKRDKGELLMLVVSELSEAMEGARKNLMDDHLPHRKMEEVEMADALIRLLDYAGGFNIQLSEQGVKFHAENGRAQLLEIVSELCTAWWNSLGEIHTTESIRLSRAVSGIILYCEQRKFDLWGAFAEKMSYNAQRHDHTHEARQKHDGKKF